MAEPIISLVGDSFLQPPGGYGEFLEARLLLDQPDFPYGVSRFTKPDLTWETVFKEAPWHVIGKNPKLVVFSLGLKNDFNGKSAEEVWEQTRECLELIADKLKSAVAVTNCPALLYLGQEERYQKALDYNALLHRWDPPQRVRVMDVVEPGEAFLSAHRLGRGEKQALHVEGGNLTAMGKLLMSNVVFSGVSALLKQAEVA